MATKVERTNSWGIVERGILSTVMEPSKMGSRRRSADKREDLPLQMEGVIFG